MKNAESGFTLVETIVGAAVAFFVIWTLVAIANRSVTAAAHLHAMMSGENAAARLTERLGSESASAWAVWVPGRDVVGDNDADGHEVDLFAEDGAHRAHAWAYRYDAQTHLLTRYAYAPGVPAQPGEIMGYFDSFRAVMGDPGALGDPSNRDWYDPLLAGVSAPLVHYAFASMPSAQGGNGLVNVSLSASGVEQSIIITGAAAPTTFTIVLPYTPAPIPATPTPGPLPTLTP